MHLSANVPVRVRAPDGQYLDTGQHGSRNAPRVEKIS